MQTEPRLVPKTNHPFGIIAYLGDAILVMLDWFSQLAHMLLTVQIATTFETTFLFLNGFRRHHGLPKLILLDGDLNFTSAFWRQIFRKIETKYALAWPSISKRMGRQA